MRQTLRELTIWAHCSVALFAKAGALAAGHALHCIPNRLVRTHPIYEMSSSKSSKTKVSIKLKIQYKTGLMQNRPSKA